MTCVACLNGAKRKIQVLLLVHIIPIPFTDLQGASIHGAHTVKYFVIKHTV